MSKPAYTYSNATFNTASSTHEKTRDWLSNISGSNSPQLWFQRLGSVKGIATDDDLVNGQARPAPRHIDQVDLIPYESKRERATEDANSTRGDASTAAQSLAEWLASEGAGGDGADVSQRITKEAQSLVSWARSAGRFIDPAAFDRRGLTSPIGGSEIPGQRQPGSEHLTIHHAGGT